MSVLSDCKRPVLLKNSLSGEKGSWAKKIDVHNRSVFDDLASGQVSHTFEKHGFEFFNRIGQEPAFKLFLHSSHSQEPSCCRHTNFLPVRTIIAYADGLPECPLNESISYFELRCFAKIKMRTGGAIGQRLCISKE